MDALQRYELISPILKHKKTAKQVHQETNVPPGTIHGYLKRLREGGQRIESLTDKSCASHFPPKLAHRRRQRHGASESRRDKADLGWWADRVFIAHKSWGLNNE